MSLNLRNEIVMATQFAEKEFRAHFPAGASYQECFDALRQFADKILEMSKAYEAASSTEATADGAAVSPDQQQAVEQATQDALQQAMDKQASVTPTATS